MQKDLNTDTAKPVFALTASAVLKRFNVDPRTGLSTRQAARRRKTFGPNILVQGGSINPLIMLIRQFSDLMIIVLLVAAFIAGAIGEALDAVAILVIVILNGIVGFVQEYRAERALEALQQLSAPHVQVLRHSRRHVIEEAHLVPGDIVFLEAGNIVPADMRVVRTTDLTIDEASLTGESMAVVKRAKARLAMDVPLGDRVTMAHKGTHVTSGRALCVAVATGDNTELGNIAQLMRAGKRPPTPLQKRLASFGRRLSIAVLVICAIIFLFGLARGEEPMLMLLTAISLAVAAIPEALPAVVTIALALGAKRMAGRNALVRRLPAVETLGSVTVICCDKTGTLTQNTMRAERFMTADHETEQLQTVDQADRSWRHLVRAMALNTDVEPDAGGQAQGEPTELAIHQAAHAADADVSRHEKQWRRVSDIPFDADRRRMSTLHVDKKGGLVIVKGAPEVVLPLCKDRQTSGGRRRLNAQAVLASAEDAARLGYRMLAFAERSLDKLPKPAKAEDIEHDLTFLGLVALADPPRPEVNAALAACADAGIDVVMITGDHPATARAIATNLGFAGDSVMTGAELAALTPQERSRAAEDTNVYARVTPSQKLDIIEALRGHGQYVAMTGDGVNDAPALKRADIGIAMGQKGTDVAREAADIVLLDDNFATIVSAVREGRRIYDNIRKFISYTMTSNAGEIWTILLAPFLGLPLPLLPIQILWINLVTDGLPGLALAVEPEESDVMSRPPRAPEESVFSHGAWQHMVWVGLLIGALSLGALMWAHQNGSGNWQTLVFTVLTFSQLVHVLAMRSERESIFAIDFLGNLPLLGAVGLSVGLQAAIVYWPPAQTVFRTTGLAYEELIVALALPWVVLIACEIEKWLVRQGLIYQPLPANKPQLCRASRT